MAQIVDPHVAQPRLASASIPCVENRHIGLAGFHIGENPVATLQPRSLSLAFGLFQNA